MSTIRIRTAINQNNAAVSMIGSARYNEAICMLKASMRQFQKELRSHAANDNVHSEPCATAIHHLILQSATTSLLDRGDGSNDEAGFLYDQAVFIPQRVSLERHIATHVVSSIQIFNLALALQLKANATKADSRLRDSCLRNAMSIYRLVMMLNGSNGLLSMIVLNNVGLIHRACKNHDRASECFSRLLAIWMVSPVCAKYLEGMIHNALGWYDTSALPAAAA
ncbi:unnamed protein product [Cylindrotheca closterium]|uniref:Uncharacterized protein n=1 Tax=Cylindrotheca closterium TaxID=2856 RepID=A0AAD2FMY5_9STRA|nr:unnamed protein product [Cylindrotheca closterium]